MSSSKMFRQLQRNRFLAGGQLLSSPFRAPAASRDLTDVAVASSSEGRDYSFVKTAESNPVNLTDRHLARFYPIDDSLFQKLFIPHHGFPVEFREQFKVFREQRVMVRKHYLDLKNCVESLDLKKPVVRFILYGSLGTGKSVTVGSMVHYGYVKEFILLHFPWMPLWTSYAKELVPSAKREGYFDHDITAVHWLTHFKAQNEERIQQLNLVSGVDYTWSKREETPKGSSLLDIVEHGISRPVHATECMYAIIEELKQLSTDGKCKTMALVDGINGLFFQSKFLQRRDKTLIPHSHVTAFEAIKSLMKADWSGGVVITTVDQIVIPPENRESDLPRYLLQKEGWELFDPFVPIEVPNYTSQEVQSTLDYYLDRKWLAHPASATEAGRLEIEYISAKNPLTLMRVCGSR